MLRPCPPTRYILDGDAAGGDYTGTIFALAGLVLIGLAVKLAADSLRGRTEPAR